MAGFEVNEPEHAHDETSPLLPAAEDKKAKPVKQVTPLPMVQIGILLFFQLAEPITAQCIYPFINQVPPLCSRWGPSPLNVTLIPRSS